MNPRTAPGVRRRSLVGLLLALAVVAAVAVAVAAPQARAYNYYVHGGIVSCAACHLDGHTNWKPVSEVCNTCHAGFARPKASMTCWTCHTPVQDMTGARSDVSCTSVCHLADGTTSTHVAHAGRSPACSTCHLLTASLTDAAGSPHHASPRLPAPVVASFLPSSAAVGDRLILTGSGLTNAYAVAVNGTRAPAFLVISDTQITVTVPAGATSGPITVATPGGTGTSATSLNIVTGVTARLTLGLRSSTVTLGKAARMTGTLTPAVLAGARVGLTVRLWRSGTWRAAKSATVNTKPGGGYSWAYRPPGRGRYSVRATVAGTATHTGAHTRWAAFTVR